MKIKRVLTNLFISVCFIFIFDADSGWTEVLKVKIAGYSDGIYNGIQQDKKEAILDAKRQAIEKAGVKIDSKTVVKNYIAIEDMIEAQSKAIILPGFEIIEIGYDKNQEVFKVVLVGSIQSIVETEINYSKYIKYGVVGILILVVLRILFLKTKTQNTIQPIQEFLRGFVEAKIGKKIYMRDQKQHKQDETPEMNNYQQSLESQKNLDKSNQRFVKELNNMDIYSRLRERGKNRLGKFQIKEIKRISYEEIHFIMDNNVLILRKGNKDVTQRF